MTETDKTLKSKRPPGRPKERINAKRRMLYIEDMIWTQLKICSLFQKMPISKIVEEATVQYLEDKEFIKQIDLNEEIYKPVNTRVLG